MLSLSRNVSKELVRPLTRSFAQVVPPNVNSGSTASSQSAGPSKSRRKTTHKSEIPAPALTEKVPVKEDHGLYAFFRKKPDSDNLVGEDKYEVVESPEAGQLITGRAWEASELRNKSFLDLHTLWYVALREKNLLATQREEARRMGVSHSELQVPMAKVRNCRKTMARIKMVLNERRLAYEGARKLAEQEAEQALENDLSSAAFDEEDSKILNFQLREKTRVKPAQKTVATQSGSSSS
ncbi:hypothetical protein D9613_005937 [Agrocybe pediades]|uniref:Large ribosomal subunit protein uL29m n=1 Tax=Agrocybe pediades TaxID=84607 RepID=A0A8H4VPF0_9AGAR|nr:hypothetical protein D9613_005937 [Agrocybe pediades]